MTWHFTRMRHRVVSDPIFQYKPEQNRRLAYTRKSNIMLPYHWVVRITRWFVCMCDARRKKNMVCEKRMYVFRVCPFFAYRNPTNTLHYKCGPLDRWASSYVIRFLYCRCRRHCCCCRCVTVFVYCSYFSNFCSRWALCVKISMDEYLMYISVSTHIDMFEGK